MDTATQSNTTKVRAAQYIRMSSDRQTYSIEYQMAANADYAASHDLEIVQTYIDAGISGLELTRRAGLQKLLADVVSGTCDFTMILVYDVSRWGRFQDLDESAHYEFICREAGVSVTYCAEPFDNDGSMLSAFAKHLKRAMAAEYSRDLSSKVARAQRGLALKGYWQGGPPGFGFRRRVLSYDGSSGRLLERGEQNAVRGDRIVLVAGPPDEVETVRQIYRLFVEERFSVRDIVGWLNAEGVPGYSGARWSQSLVRRILTEEKYAGAILVGRCETRLGRTTRRRRSECIRLLGACPALVDADVYAAARQMMRKSKPVGSDDDLIEELRGVLARHGRLSFKVIARDEDAHSPSVYMQRFGGLLAAFDRVGYQPSARQIAARLSCLRWKPNKHRPDLLSDEVLLEGLRDLLARTGSMSSDLINSHPELPSHSTYVRRFGSMANIYRLLDYPPTPRQAAVLAAKARLAERASAAARPVSPALD